MTSNSDDLAVFGIYLLPIIICFDQSDFGLQSFPFNHFWCSKGVRLDKIIYTMPYNLFSGAYTQYWDTRCLSIHRK